VVLLRIARACSSQYSNVKLVANTLGKIIDDNSKQNSTYVGSSLQMSLFSLFTISSI
jgi:hypothetical protein